MPRSWPRFLWLRVPAVLVIFVVASQLLVGLVAAAPLAVFVDDGFTAENAGEHTFGVDAFATIGEAVEAVAAGGTIKVAAGAYDEVVDIEQSVTLLGANAGIDPNTGTRSVESTITGSGAIRLFGSASGVSIDGFEFTATPGAIGQESAAILLPPGYDGGNAAPFNAFQNITIQNNWFHDLSGRPVLKDCYATFDGLTISNNRIEHVSDPGDRSGIKIQSRCGDGPPSTGLTISGNVIDGTTYAA